MRLLSCLLVSAFCGWAATALMAQSPVGTAFTYQGELRSGGAPITGTVDLRFRLYDAATLGVQIGGQVEYLNTTPGQGRVALSLDFGAGSFGLNARWLEIDLRNPAGTGSWVTLSPRQAVTAAPVALYALNADSANAASTAANATQFNGQGPSFYQNAANLSSGSIPDARLSGTYSGVLSLSNSANAFSGSGAGLVGLNASNIATGTLSDGRLSSNVALRNALNAFTSTNTFAGNVGIGTSAPGFPLTVVGRMSLISSANADAAAFTNSGTSGAGIAAGGPIGVYGTSASATGRAVMGEATGSTGASYGGFFTAASSGGTGVYGRATATSGFTWGGLFVSDSVSGIGVYGEVPASTGWTYGVMGLSGSSEHGVGVYGKASASTGGTFGGYFETPSTSGKGLFAHATSVSGVTDGVYGQSNSSQGTGVHGLAASTSGFPTGVTGESFSSTGTGVYGFVGTATGVNQGVVGRSLSTSGTGLYGEAAATSGTTYGVFGQSNSSAGYGGYFQGRGYFSDNVGIGTVNPTSPLHIYRPPGVEAILGLSSNTSPMQLNRTHTQIVSNGHFISFRQLNDDGSIRQVPLTMSPSGNVGIGVTNPQSALDVNGTTRTKVLQILGGADLAEPFDVTSPDAHADVVPGMVVVIDEACPGALRLSDRAYDSKVAGVISGANGLSPGMVMRAEGQDHADGKHPIALTGRVWVYADATYGAITPGDRLTTSATPGHAMRVGDPARSVGAVIGKAMTGLNEGRGLVLVLVNLQ